MRFPHSCRCLPQGRVLTCLLAGLLFATLQSAAGSSAFTYQGRLLEGGAPANGNYDLRFTLFDNAADGAACAPPLVQEATPVAAGLFTVPLDFGTNVFNGQACWLEIAVRPGGSEVEFLALAPRQPLSATPYSIYTLKAESLSGPLPEAQLPPSVARLDADQTFTGTVTFNGPVMVGSSNVVALNVQGTDTASLNVQGTVQAGSFQGDGSGLTNIVATALSARLAARFWRVAIPFVTVTNAGNEPDLNGKGSVPYNYRIGKYEINNHQYVAFLNAVAAEDLHGLYDSNMTVSTHGGILREGVPGAFHYTAKEGHEQKPVVWVDYHDILRFCNWLHHGQPSGAQDKTTTEDGAYTLTPQGVLANSIMRNPGAHFWIPSDDEWYKAAYHQPWEAGGEVHGYWLFPNRSHDAPISEPPPGGPRSANVCCETGHTATDIGAYVNAPTYYGTFDQAGNVQEWTEEVIYVTNRRLRGGSWLYNEFYAESDDFEFDTPDYPADGIGFRVAGAAEP